MTSPKQVMPTGWFKSPSSHWYPRKSPQIRPLFVLNSQGWWSIMPSMNVIESNPHGGHWPYGVWPRATQNLISTNPSWFTSIFLIMEFKTDFFLSTSASPSTYFLNWFLNTSKFSAVGALISSCFIILFCKSLNLCSSSCILMMTLSLGTRSSTNNSCYNCILPE